MRTLVPIMIFVLGVMLADLAFNHGAITVATLELLRQTRVRLGF